MHQKQRPGSVYSRGAFIRGWRLFEVALFEDGVYFRTAFNIFAVFEGGVYSSNYDI